MPHITPGGTNIFLDLGFEPEEAANLKIRSDLMREIDTFIRSEGLTQAKAAKLFGVTQPRISNLLKGKIELFSIDSLVKMLAAVGRRVEVEVLTDSHSSEA